MQFDLFAPAVPAPVAPRRSFFKAPVSLLARPLLFGSALTAMLQAQAQSADVTPVVHVDNPLNTPAQQAKHYVILVSLDGFRYDYPTKYGAPHITSMGAQ